MPSLRSSEDDALTAQLSHADQTSIRERHGQIGVLRHQLCDPVCLAFKVEGQTKVPISQEAQELLNGRWQSAQEVASLRDDGLARKEGGRESAELRRGPFMVLVTPVQVGN